VAARLRTHIGLAAGFAGSPTGDGRNRVDVSSRVIGIFGRTNARMSGGSDVWWPDTHAARSGRVVVRRRIVEHGGAAGSRDDGRLVGQADRPEEGSDRCGLHDQGDHAKAGAALGTAKSIDIMDAAKQVSPGNVCGWRTTHTHATGVRGSALARVVCSAVRPSARFAVVPRDARPEALPTHPALKRSHESSAQTDPALLALDIFLSLGDTFAD
jgi:hypothetical protein